MLSYDDAEVKRLVDALAEGIDEGDLVAGWKKGDANKHIRCLEAYNDIVIAWVPKEQAANLKREASDIKRISNVGIRTPDILSFDGANVFESHICSSGDEITFFLMEFINPSTDFKLASSWKGLKIAIKTLDDKAQQTAVNDVKNLVDILVKEVTIRDLQVLLDTTTGHVFVFDPMGVTKEKTTFPSRDTTTISEILDLA